MATIKVRGSDFWFEEKIVWVGKDQKQYGSENDALKTFGIDPDTGSADWVEVTTLADKCRIMAFAQWRSYPESVFVEPV